jgi:hypothetical protein
MKHLFLLLAAISSFACATSQVLYPGDGPGKATVKTLPGHHVILENDVIKLEFAYDGKKITINGFEDKKTHEQLKLVDIPLFELNLQDSSVLTSNDFTVVKSPVTSNINVNPQAKIYAERLAGKKYTADLENQKLGLNVHWEADLRDGSNYVRQFFTFTAKDPQKVSRITLIKLPDDIVARKEGTVDGSPIIHNNMFFALEYPLARVRKDNTCMTAFLPRLIPVISSVWGTTPINQLRRGFLYYIERERNHPYHQELVYDTWFDISWLDRKINENLCLDRIKTFGDSLIIKRKVQIQAFLFDDGWDDNKTLWQFNSGFPNGFTNLRKAVESYNSTLGVWLSPIGGYDNPGKERREYGRNQTPPFETNDMGFTLTGPVYYKRFKDVAVSFINNSNVSIFKLDGVGVGSGAGMIYQKDVEAFLKLVNELKALKPDLYFNLTSGTWASPYWLFQGDNIYRGGSDTEMMGEGSKRQQWINYRDAQVYKNVVNGGPLYPINSIMLHGIVIAENGYAGSWEMTDKDISDEIWSYFGTGINLHELYVNPHMLNTADWNCLAAASTWAKENESVLSDVHWIGGDPGKGEVYGYAAWSPKKATLTLRNPSKVEKTFEVSVSKVFELPDNVKNNYIFYDAKAGTIDKKQGLAQGESFLITLQPFEVKVMNALPEK